MVLINELWDQSGAEIEEIISSLKQDHLELDHEDFTTRIDQILKTFHKTHESLRPVHHLFNGLDLESIPELHISSEVLLQLLLKNSRGSEEEGELREATSSNNQLELSVQQANYEYQGVLVPSRLKQMETIWEWLINDRVRTIAIQGEDGVGKTWMARQLKDRVIKANLFDIVIWIDSNLRSILEAQEHIVDVLGLSITRESGENYEEEDLKRDVTLALGKKSYLLIINDSMYYDDDLAYFGFSKHNVSSKMLITGREEHIMETDMNIRVDYLDDDEAWLLFLGITGFDIDSPGVLEIAKPLVNTFMGEPSKIISGGGDVVELTNRVRHFLNTGKIEVIECLWFCISLSKWDKIKVIDLIPWWIMEVFDGCLCFEEAKEKAEHMLQELIDGQFLERNETHVWVKTELISYLDLYSLTSNIPMEYEEKRSCSKEVIPRKEFNNKRSCVMNETFGILSCDTMEETELWLINGKEGYLPRYIPYTFIQKIQKLHTLAILNAGIASLPESLSNLENLEILIIRGCGLLKNLDTIRGLRNLKRLCLSGASSLNEIPYDFFQNLDRLKELDLSNSSLKKLPDLCRINFLILQGCSRLKSFVHNISSLILLDLSGACALTSIPDTVYFIHTLNLSGTLIESLPSPYNLMQLFRLFLRGCTKITTMPHPGDYQNLKILDLSGATSFREFQKPNSFCENSTFWEIDLSGTLIAQVPTFHIRTKIPKFLIRNCIHLETWPGLDFNLVVLDLSGSIAFKNFYDAPLSDSLRYLDLSRTQIQKLPFLPMPSAMVQLILKECGLLEELPHLELGRLQVLDLSGSTKFKTFNQDSFYKLPKLKTLNLSETLVANIPTLSHCSELRHLILRKCLKLEELPHLNTLEKLELLDLSGAISFKQFEDESFGNMEELHELNLSETQVLQIPSVSECYKLRKLILGGCSKLEILPYLEDLQRLNVLNLSKTISLINYHYQFPGHLQVLDLSETQISDLSFITRCTDLRQLSLRDCPNILTLQPLDKLRRLEKLDLSKTETSELPYLSGCESLRELLLNDCSNIHELTSLMEHTLLEVLDLSGTKIEDFSLLSSFNKLTQLSLRGCLSLKTLSFEGMQNLQKVDLSHNPIEFFPSAFSGLKNLRTLLLTECSSLESLPHMEFLPKLEVLDLSCTKVRETPNGIPALTHLRFLKLQEETSFWKFHDGNCFEKFHFCLFAPKEQIRENDIYLLGQQYSFKDIYYQTSHIPSITEESDKFFKICGFQTFPDCIQEVLLHVELLYLKKNSFFTRLTDLGAKNVKNMRECWIENCDSMETVFYGEEEDENAALGRCLQNLWVLNLPELKNLFGGVVQPGSFTLLKHLYIECCLSLVTLFSSHLELKNLEMLMIKFCDKIKGIFGETVVGEKTLPKLKTLVLFKLPQLESICGGVLPSLKNLTVIGCSKIKRLPVSKNTSPVKIKGEAVWLNDLDWEDDDTKSHQQFSLF